jgi:RimJ/RimL family protein N-acetyltransferase
MKNAFQTGERIFLRALEVEDGELLRSWLNEPENHQHLSHSRPLSAAAEREWLEGLHKRPEDQVFGIALRETGALIGSCGLHKIAFPHRSAELGIQIGELACQGKGFGSEAIRLLLAYGFDTLGLHRIELRVHENNPRAIRCYERLGFRREGEKREARWWAGRWWSVLEYALLESEWGTLRA